MSDFMLMAERAFKDRDAAIARAERAEAANADLQRRLDEAVEALRLAQPFVNCAYSYSMSDEWHDINKVENAVAASLVNAEKEGDRG